MDPIKIPSGKYDEKFKVDRTHLDLITEMSQELCDLPRFVAHSKVLQEKAEDQAVLKCKIKTEPLPALPQGNLAVEYAEFEILVKERTHERYCKERTKIEEEFRQRQVNWRGNSPKGPPPATS